MVRGLSLPLKSRILVPGPGIEPVVPHRLTGGFLATGAPGKSPPCLFLSTSKLCMGWVATGEGEFHGWMNTSSFVALSGFCSKAPGSYLHPGHRFGVSCHRAQSTVVSAGKGAFVLVPQCCTSPPLGSFRKRAPLAP